jgi:hypothetical protein
MNPNDLLGRQILIHGSFEPPFDTSVVAVIQTVDLNSDSLQVKLISPLQIRGQLYPFAITSPHLHGQNLKMFLDKGYLGCSITCVSQDHYNSAHPFDLSWWRGGPAAIGDIVLCSTNCPISFS